MKNYWLFLNAWLRNPKATGAIAPSSNALSCAMAARLPANDGWVIELGGGTGSITQALLAAGISREKLLVVERDPTLCLHLRREFPGVKVLQGDVCELGQILRSEGIGGPIRGVVSGLPLLSMSPLARRQVLSEVVECTNHGSPLIQFTYSPFCPVSRELRDALGIGAQRAQTIWLNLPPATVWEFSSRATKGYAGAA